MGIRTVTGRKRMQRDVTDMGSNVQRIAVGPRGSPGQYPPNVFLITGESRAVFVDTAYGKDDEIEAALGAWKAKGSLPVAAIVLSHRHEDHIGGAARLREVTGGDVVAAADERDGIAEQSSGLRIDAVVADGDTMDLGGVTLEFIEAPGHTMGSVCVLYREEGVLFTGDTILGGSTTAISPDHGDMGLYVESLRKLLKYDARVIGPGHGPVIDDPKAKIEKLIGHRESRERQMLGLLKDGGGTVEELFGSLYDGLKPGLHDSARQQIRAHLMKLQREGRVEVGTDGAYTVSETP